MDDHWTNTNKNKDQMKVPPLSHATSTRSYSVCVRDRNVIKTVECPKDAPLRTFLDFSRLWEKPGLVNDGNSLSNSNDVFSCSLHCHKTQITWTSGTQRGGGRLKATHTHFFLQVSQIKVITCIFVYNPVYKRTRLKPHWNTAVPQ